MKTIDPTLTTSEFDTILLALQMYQQNPPNIPQFISINVLTPQETDELVTYLQQCKGRDNDA